MAEFKVPEVTWRAERPCRGFEIVSLEMMIWLKVLLNVWPLTVTPTNAAIVFRLRPVDRLRGGLQVFAFGSFA